MAFANLVNIITYYVHLLTINPSTANNLISKCLQLTGICLSLTFLIESITNRSLTAAHPWIPLDCCELVC
jgi:hypothetical protein